MGIFKKGVNIFKKGVNVWWGQKVWYYTKLTPILLDTVSGGKGGDVYNDLLNINQDGIAVQAFQEPVDPPPPPNSDNTMMYILAGGAILILILTILLLRKK